ncbi:MAG: hypothetical protein C6Y22_12560 [Hapalosiphonaceae cyanobacterium JJU2]|nr:MAG: hypothetical protein C6Y22_12560 [Hapalosiphonaceae cyanobacterium JJU2]
MQRINLELKGISAIASAALNAAQTAAGGISSVGAVASRAESKAEQALNKPIGGGLSQSDLSKRFDEEFEKFKRSTTMSMEEKWQQSLKESEEWLRNSYQTEKIVFEVERRMFNSFGNIDVQVKEVKTLVGNLSQQVNDNNQVQQEQEQKILQEVDRRDNQVRQETGQKLSEQKRTLEQSQQEFNDEIDKIRREFDENAKASQGDTKALEAQFQRYIEENNRKLGLQIDQRAEQLEKQINSVDDRLKQGSNITADELNKIKERLSQNEWGVNFALDKLPEIPQIRESLKKVETAIPEIDTKLREQEKVNKEAIPKLDNIIGVLGLIPGRVRDTIKPDIPTVPDIERAVGTGICQSANGGCLGNSLNNTANGINSNTNRNANNINEAIFMDMNPSV